MFDVYGTLATWSPDRTVIQSRAAAQFGVNITREAIDAGYAVADTHMAQVTAERPLQSMNDDEKAEFFARFEQMVLDGAGVHVDLELAGRIWDVVTSQNYDLALFDDVLDNLRNLRLQGYKLGIISNMNVSGEELATHLGMMDYIDFAVTSDEVGSTKPSPEIFLEALRRAGDMRPEDAVMIGDQPSTDMAGASASGISGILLDRYHLHQSYTDHPRVTSMDELNEMMASVRNDSQSGRPSGMSGRDGRTSVGMNKTQRLQQWYDENPAADTVLYGEYMHVGANQTILRTGLHDVELSPDSVVLDMACAVGGNGRWLASLYGCRVYGNDINERAIAVANELAEIEGIADLCHFFTADVSAVGLKDASCDLVVSTDVYNMAEVARVLRPGGRFLLSALFKPVSQTAEQMVEDMSQEWGLHLEMRRDITELAQTFHHAKEAEARMLQRSGVITGKQYVQVLNEIINPNRRGGHHLLVRWQKPEK